MSRTEIKLYDHGPLLVSGEVELLDADGRPFQAPQNFALCRCGLSKTRPFCDGAHRGNFADETRAK